MVKRYKRGLDLDDLADLERSKRAPSDRDYHRSRQRELARRERTAEPYRQAEGDGQGVLFEDEQP